MGYVLRSNLHRFLQMCYYEQVVVLKASKLFGWQFGMERGVTQRDPFSPTISNIVVDAVVSVFLLEIGGPREAYNGLVWVAGEHNIILYAVNGRIPGCNPIWFQTTLKKVVRIF